MTDEGESTGRDGRERDRDRIPVDAGGRDVDEDDESDGDEGARAPEPNSTPIEAGSPALEHALFVLLGAIAMVLTVVRLIQVSLGF